MSGFEKGNKAAKGAGRPPLAEDIRFIRKQSQKHFLRIFEMYGNMPMKQLQTFADNPDSLPAKHLMMITFWMKLQQEADPQRMKLLMSVLGIPTEIKAIGLGELNKVPDDENFGRTLDERKKEITNDQILEVIKLGPSPDDIDSDDED